MAPNPRRVLVSATAPRERALATIAADVLVPADPLVEAPRAAAPLGPARPNRGSAIVPLVQR